MFEAAELGRKVSKTIYEERVPELRTTLLRVQSELRQADFPVIVVISGVDGAGKGETINLLHEWMDSRYLETHGFTQPSDEERERPAFWRFWRTLPARGRIGIYAGSWYTDPISQRMKGVTSDAELETALIRINTFEKELVDDGALIIKFWFHLSKAVQEKRLKKLGKSPTTRWRVSELSRRNLKDFDAFVQVAERTLRGTSTGEAPWTIVEGTDERYRALTVGEHILEALSKRLANGRGQASAGFASPTKATADLPTVLSSLDLSKSLSRKRYKHDLGLYQGKLNGLWHRTVARKISIIAVFEGWDAAGKGGIIRRITPAMDARFYQVISTAAPSDEEKAHHYLWRFWRHLPSSGRMTLFDRSWYGRVLVERIEGFAKEHEWRRAYTEINDFEEQLIEHGIVLIKYWIHIDKDEQLRRFKERETTPFKQHKITEEDYRNREKWEAYETAVNDMIERTSTEYAPWTLIEGNDKRYARVKALKVFCERLEQALSRHHAPEHAASAQRA